MDRRYSQSRFYSGVPASNRSEARAHALVRHHMARARKAAAAAKNYGGSTGGTKSIDSNRGLNVLKQRGAEMAERNKIFEEEGTGVYGARAVFGESRNLPDLGQ